ncbi:hypothetical protein ACFLZY_02610 [Patescibacteria group bacterium]
MTFRYYIILMTLATIAAWAGWIVVIVSIDPTQTSQLGFVFFYSTLSIALFGSLSIIGAGLRIWFKQDELISRHVSKAARQAFLLSTLLIGSIILLTNGLFTLLTGMLFVTLLALVEFVFISAGRKKPLPLLE